MRKPNPKNGKDFWMAKMPLELKAELDKVRIARIKLGKDTRLVPYTRLGLAITRHEKLLEDLIKADLIENEK